MNTFGNNGYIELLRNANTGLAQNTWIPNTKVTYTKICDITRKTYTDYYGHTPEADIVHNVDECVIHVPTDLEHNVVKTIYQADKVETIKDKAIKLVTNAMNYIADMWGGM